MAFIGMRHVVCAQVDEHTAGSEPTYTSDGMDVGRAISANLTINRNSNPLYADDVLAEDDNGITSMELELAVDDITDDVKAYMGIVKAVTTGTGTTVTTYYDTSDSSNPCGLGYIRVRRKSDVTTYQAVWIYKAMFTVNSEASQTKAESVEWQTTTINARCAGLAITGTGEMTFRAVQNFTTESAAAAWLDAKAGITRT